MSKSRVIIMKIESQKMGLNKAVDRAHRSVTKCMMDRSPKKPAPEKSSSATTNPSVPPADVELAKTTRIANAATCLDRVGGRLDRNPTKGTYRIANTTAAATDSMPMTFAKSIFVDDRTFRS